MLLLTALGRILVVQPNQLVGFLLPYVMASISWRRRPSQSDQLVYLKNALIYNHQILYGHLCQHTSTAMLDMNVTSYFRLEVIAKKNR